jgi:hypothetical protein
LQNLFQQVYSALVDLIGTTSGGWQDMSPLVRLVVAMLLAGLFVYAGTRTEHIGWSTLWFFVAFACLAYLVANGVTLMR